jgi:hypothetical protein
LPEELRNQAVGAALVGWAGDHPVDALSWAVANGVNVGEARAIAYYGDENRGWQSLLMVAFGSDRAKALEWVLAQPSSQQRDVMLRDSIWNGTPDEKMNVYGQLTPDGRSSMAGSLASSLARTDMQRAEAWVADLPAGRARVAAVQAIAQYKAESMPDQIETLAGAWTTSADRNAALRGILEAQRDPARALTFARRMDDPKMRETAFESIASDWIWRNETAARAWIVGTNELSPEQKRVLLREADER